MVDAEREYAMLTGLQSRPEKTFQETLTLAEEVPRSHPYLSLLESNIAQAEANIHQVETEFKGSPVLTLGGRRERAEALSDYNDSIGISISMPIGGKALVSSKTSTARREKVDAEVIYQNTLRSLRQALHEAEHELALAGKALLLTTQQSKLSKQLWEMSESAFSQGELTLPAVVMAFQTYQLNQTEEIRLVLQQQRLISEFNQIVGVLP